METIFKFREFTSMELFYKVAEICDYATKHNLSKLDCDMMAKMYVKLYKICMN